jgi:Fe-S-cluster containining protein
MMKCRDGCGACCIAPSITSKLPGMPQGKPAGQRCAQLTETLRCAVFGKSERPAFCAGLKASPEMCGESREQALIWLNNLERETCGIIPP